MRINESTRKFVVEVISALFILLFVYAAVSKLLDFQKFRIELAKSPVLNAISGYTSVIVPSCEVLLSILLAIKRFQYFALYACFGLMVMFSCYIIVILKLSPYIPCTCGGILENMNWKQHLIFNIGYVILGIIGVLLYPSEKKNLSAVRG